MCRAEDALETVLRESGVAFAALEVTDHPGRGLVAELQLYGGASPEAAGRVLGRFALPFTIR